jgi:hypothetical protein
MLSQTVKQSGFRQKSLYDARLALMAGTSWRAFTVE